MVYPLIRRGLRRAGLVMSSHGPSSYGRTYELSGAPGGFSSTAYSGKKKRFRNPLVTGESNWQTISGEERLVGPKGPGGPYDGRGIKVVNETIVERD